MSITAPTPAAHHPADTAPDSTKININTTKGVFKYFSHPGKATIKDRCHITRKTINKKLKMIRKYLSI
jgi:hypothetical protein